MLGSDWLGAAGVLHFPPQLVDLPEGVSQTNDARLNLCSTRNHHQQIGSAYSVTITFPLL